MKTFLLYAAAFAAVLVVAYITRDVIIYNAKGDGFNVGFAIFLVGISLILAQLAWRQRWLE